MKILLVNDYGGATGGAEIQMLTLRQQLRDRGHDARLFASNAKLSRIVLFWLTIFATAPLRAELKLFRKRLIFPPTKRSNEP